MVFSVFKTSFKKQKPNIVTYRDDRDFDNEIFRESLVTYSNTAKNISHEMLCAIQMVPDRAKRFI